MPECQFDYDFFFYYLGGTIFKLRADSTAIQSQGKRKTWRLKHEMNFLKCSEASEQRKKIKIAAVFSPSCVFLSRPLFAVWLKASDIEGKINVLRRSSRTTAGLHKSESVSQDRPEPISLKARPCSWWIFDRTKYITFFKRNAFKLFHCMRGAKSYDHLAFIRTREKQQNKWKYINSDKKIKMKHILSLLKGLRFHGHWSRLVKYALSGWELGRAV